MGDSSPRRSRRAGANGHGPGNGTSTARRRPTAAFTLQPDMAPASDRSVFPDDQAEVDLTLAEFLPGEPSDALGAAVIAADTGASPRQLVTDTRLWNVTGGWPATPFVLLTVIAALDQVDKLLFGVLTPEIKDYFGIGIGSIAALTLLTGLLGLAVAIPFGYYVDRVSRVKLSALGALLLGVFAICTGLAPTVVLVAAARFGSGLGATLETGHLSLLSDYYPQETRAGVFTARELCIRIARFVLPPILGFAAGALFWQLGFFLLAIPMFGAAALLMTRLREPARGQMERRAMGASEEVAQLEERPPSMGEGWRIAWGVRSLRRVCWSLPFLVGAGLGIVQLLSLYYDERFHVGPGARGLLVGLNEPMAMLGIIVGGLVTNRLMRYRPGRVITYAGLMGVVAGLMFVGIALAPWLALAVGFALLMSFATSILTPALLSIVSLVAPPRARGIGLSVAAVYVGAGLFIYYFGASLADSHGIRTAILFMVPVFVIGACILASAGNSVDGDIRAAMAAAMAADISRRSKEQGEAKLLVCKDVDVHYGDVQVLFNVDFIVDEGEVIALLGTNGAGKSTLLRAISGLSEASNGAVFFDGEDITHLPASEHAARGIIQSPGGRGTFPTLTVAENLRLAAWMFRNDDEYVRVASEQVFDYFPILRQRMHEAAGNLSGGEQQMLTLSQAFLSRPRLLMIDELSLGLAPAIVEQLLGIVRAIAEQGTTIILVEQSVNIALTVAQRAVFMEKGEVKFTGSTAELMQRPDILRSVYLKGSASAGGSFAAPSAKRGRPEAVAGDVALELKSVSKRFGGISAINDVSFTVRDGQILGLIGPNGAGKTTLFDLISGFVEPDAGLVTLFGEDITYLGPDGRAKLGLQRSFQDAALFPALTVAENIAVALEQHVEVKSTTMAALRLPNVRRSEAKLNRRVDRLIGLLGLGEFRDKFVRELSTGSRRLVDLACCMAADPKVLLLDEPSSGIAQKEAEELGPLLQRIKFETGCTLLIIEHDMPLIMSVSDELLALELGAVVTRGLPRDVVEHPQVVASYLGTSEEVINRSGSA